MKDRIDPLIFDRAPWLDSPSPWVHLVRKLLNRQLSYDQTVAVAETLRHQPARQIMALMGEMLAQDCTVTGLHNLPATGPALIVANHPTGIADGIILNHAIARIRPDAYFFANGDVLKVLPQMTDMIAPVEWRHDRRSRESARQTMDYVRRAISNERLGVIFPSGRLAKRRGLRLYERPWMSSAATLARKFDLPVIPLHLSARNSALFYLLDLLHPSLRDITLFHETLNKARQPFAVTVGRPIPASSLPHGAEEATAYLRRKTLALGRSSDGKTVSLVRATRKPALLGWAQG